MKNVIVIGSGPAGISAALYTARAGYSTTVITKGEGALKNAEKIQNYYGFSQPVIGAQLEAQAKKGAENVGVKFINSEVVGLNFSDKLLVQTTGGSLSADSVIIATGTQRSAPNVKGISDFEGKGVSYCAVCDAFFYKGKKVAVLGSGKYALHEIDELLPIASSVTLLTNGEKVSADFPKFVHIVTKKIKEIIGNDHIENIVFEDGLLLDIDGLFIAYGVAGSSDLARKIGAQTEANKIVVDEEMATNIPGLYAAGDCTGGMLQIAKAVYEGAQAGTSAVNYLRRK